MKIAIKELEAPTKILDLDRPTATEIVGGATFAATTVEVGATGPNAFTDSFTFSATFEVPNECGGFDTISVTGGFGIASDNGPVDFDLSSAFIKMPG